MSRLRGFLNLAGMAILGVSLNAVAQSTTQGAIAGTVFDTTDAVVSNAKITIHNDGTNQDVVLTSASSGEYKAPLLPPGTYTVTVDVAGFASSKTTQVVVQVGQVTTLNPHLSAGKTEQTVEVTADIPAIDFASATYGGHLSNTEIENIPINNRRWSSLALTTPGVTNDASGFGLLSFRGIPSVLNNVQIDGTDDNQAFFSEERGRTRAGYSISQISVREFQVNTGVYSAEYGRAVGGVVNSVTKSGTNNLHGEVYFYHRNDMTSSKNEKTLLTTLNPATNTYTPQVIRPKDKRNQYGFGVGGPLIKDKLFWFYAFDIFHRNFPGIAVSGNPGTFYSQTAGPCQTSGLLTATGASLAQCYAALNDLNTDLGQVARYGHQMINTPKLSWVISPKHTLDVYYHRLRWDSPGGVQTQAALSYARDSFGTDFVKLDYGIARLSSLINSRMTNELRYQYARELNWEGQQPYTDYSKAHLVGTNGVTTYASIATATGGFNLGSPYYSYRVAYPDERKWQIGDTASYQFGKHSLRFGVDFVHNYDIQNNLFQSNGSYSYASVGLYLADILKPSGACGALTASGTPSLTTAGGYGCHSGLTQGFGPQVFDLATLDSAYFVQDDWKLTPSLTVNIGARYDYQSYPGPFASAVNSAVPQEANYPSDKNNISPRIGFAWDPFGKGKSVIRGGYGIYYGRIINASLMSAYTTTGGAGGQLQLTAYNGTNLGTTAAPQYIKFPQTLSARPTGGNFGVLYLDKNLQNPYTHQFDLTIQQDLGWRNVLSVSYIGSLSRELPNYLNLNLDPTKTYNVTYTLAGAGGNCLVAACGTTFTQKVYSSRSTVSGSNTLNKAFNQITPLISNVNASYHAMTVDITNRQSRLISYDVNYTWAHALDYGPSSSTSFSPGNNWIDPYNARANYGNSNINVPHRLVGWANFNIPGRKGGDTGLGYLTNGWSIKPLVQIQKGLPYSVGTSSGSPPNQTGCTDCLQPYSSGVAGTGVSSYIPFFGRNQLFGPRNIVIDTRLQKDFRIREGMSFQLMAEAFNLANHRNITGVNSGAFSLSGSTLTATNNFGTPSTSGVNGNYAYQVRQFQFSGRIMF
ncbi:TonB-dependent receptor [Terriglobus albidus]|uniref:TonB-dependent receptor n=1 Tax=Terriglobus albidus TaxID=1592106 RepID=UPI0021E008C2|nr:TonB-dependent receptor [Terriglobus albidus]